MKPELKFSRTSNNILVVRFTGNWPVGQELPSETDLKTHLEADPSVRKVAFDTTDLEGWDSILLSFLIKLLKDCARKKIRVDGAGLPKGVKRLVKLAEFDRWAEPLNNTFSRVLAENLTRLIGNDPVVFFQ